MMQKNKKKQNRNFRLNEKQEKRVKHKTEETENNQQLRRNLR